MNRIDKTIERFHKVKSSRANYEDVWQDISEYVLPNRGDFTIRRAEGDTGNKRNVYDTTAIHSNEMLSSTLHGGLTNPASKWLGLALKDPALANEDVNRFLELASNKLLEVFNSSDSNFPAQNHEFILSLTSLGTACMFVEEDGDSVKFSTIHLAEIFIVEDRHGMIDTVFRDFDYTARQAEQLFGEDNLHPKMLEALEKDPDKKFCIVHAVMPRKDVAKGKAASKKPYASLYIDVENKHLLREGGYDEMPYIVARFSKLVGETYGRSPAWNALPDIKMVNKMSETIIKAAQLQTHPPLMVADDGVLMPLRANPNGLIMGGLSHDGTERVRPLNIGGGLNIGSEIVAQRQKMIRDSFFVDQLVFREGPQMTATEVIQRQEEKLRLLSPHLGRIQSEYLTPLVDRVLGLLFRMGRFQDVPEELSGSNVEIEYLSPLAKLQKAQETSTIQRALGGIAPFMEISPEVIDNFNPDKIARFMAESVGVPLTLLRTSDEVAELRDERAQAQQEQAALQQAQQLASINKDLPEDI